MTINIQNTIFKDLIEKYSSWEQLKTFLESAEGGLFRVVDTNDSGLVIIRYEKGTSKMDLPHSNWFRSVVWNTQTNRPVSVAPPKTSTIEFPFKTLKELSEMNIVCQELLDGFMINCCMMAGSDTVYVTSRSKLDAAGRFYSSKTFKELFMESYGNTYGSDFSALVRPKSENGETATFYSFLVQHKEHRIVKDIKENRVFLVHSGTVFSDGRIEIVDGIESIECKPFTYKINIENLKLQTGISRGSYAKVVSSNVEGISEVEKAIKNMLSEKSWDFQGVVFKDMNGNRWRFRSEKYTAVKSLRGNSPQAIERFTQLFTQNLVNKYLEYYPEENGEVILKFLLINRIVQLLYQNYVDLHITKSKKVEEIDKAFLPHLYSIHGLYLSQLRPEKKKVTQNEIQVYLHKLPWQRVAFLMKKVSV